MGVIFYNEVTSFALRLFQHSQKSCLHRVFEILQFAFFDSYLAKFQSCQSSHSEDQRKNPKANDDLVFMPTLELKVVVNR